jgi:hypothetical protein
MEDHEEESFFRAGEVQESHKRLPHPSEEVDLPGKTTRHLPVRNTSYSPWQKYQMLD